MKQDEAKKNQISQDLQAPDKAQELQPVQSQSAQVMTALVSQLESGKLAPEQLSMVLDAQERVLDRQAKQEFNIAMANCQAEMPAILKGEFNEHTKSSFEGFDALNRAVSPVYTKHGFAVSFGTDDAPVNEGQKFMMLRVTAEVTHKAGWSKEYHFDLPVDMYGIKGNENKTAMHGSASTMSYGRRYLLKMIFNLTTSDDIDDDGNAGGGVDYKRISVDQVIELGDLLTEVGGDKDAFLKYCKVDSLENLPVEKFATAKKAIQDKK